MRNMTYILLVLITLVVSDVKAAEINQTGADELKSQLTNFLQKHITSLTNTGYSVKIEGDIVVEQAGTYYAATVPTIFIQTGQELTHKIGLTAINAIPTENPKEWRISIALPSPIITTTPEGAIFNRIDIASQRVGGRWNSDFGNFTRLNAKYEKIQSQNFYQKRMITMDTIDIQINLEEDEQKTWSGAQNLVIDNLKFTNLGMNGSDINGFFSLGRFNSVLEYTKTKLPFIKTTPSKDKAGFFESIFNGFGYNLSDGFGLKVNIDNIKAKNYRPMFFNAFNFKIGNISIDSKFLNQQENKIDNLTHYSFSDYDISGNNKSLTITHPENLSLSFNINNMPYSEVSDRIFNLLSLRNNTAAMQIAMLQTMVELPQQLSQAGTTLAINNGKAKNQFYDADLTANINADKSSILGATGNALVSIDGLDNVIAEMQKKDVPQNEIQKVQILKQTCTKDESTNKNVCNVTLNNQAQILVNGTKIDILSSGIF